MSAGTIGFVHPPPESFPSGGNAYNAKVLEHAARCAFPLVSLPCGEQSLKSGNSDLLLWDSLCMDRLARIGRERTALLLHCLPSSDPTLDPRENEAWHAVERRAMAQADCVVVTGRTVAEAVAARWPDKPVFLCEPGVADVFRWHGKARADRPATLLTVANLLPAKGHQPLLDILERLRHLPWRWELAGDGERSPETARRLREQAARAGLADRITFHGPLSQDAVAALMQDCDLLVAPSLFEAYGMAVAEAAAAGLPAVAYRVGAAGQLVRHGVTGFLATAGDWDSFGEYLRALLEDAGLRARFRASLRLAPVRRWDRAFADFQAACEAMLGGRAHRARLD